MLCQLGWATGSNLVAAGASACFLRLLKSSAGSAAGSAVGSRRQPFGTTTAGAHAEVHGVRQEPADRAVASAKQHLKVKLPASKSSTRITRRVACSTSFASTRTVSKQTLL